MKNVLIALFIFLLLFPTGMIEQSKVVDIFELRANEGMVAMQSANTDFGTTVKPITPVRVCNCQGTKIEKSGDGIITVPCVCMPNCTCKKVGETIAKQDVYYYTYIFHATWCGPCIQFQNIEIPMLKMNGWKIVDNKWVDSANAVLVDVDKDQAKFTQYAITEAASPVGIPYYVVVKNDIKVASHIGYLDWKSFYKWHNSVVNLDRAK